MTCDVAGVYRLLTWQASGWSQQIGEVRLGFEFVSSCQPLHIFCVLNLLLYIFVGSSRSTVVACKVRSCFRSFTKCDLPCDDVSPDTCFSTCSSGTTDEADRSGSDGSVATLWSRCRHWGHVTKYETKIEFDQGHKLKCWRCLFALSFQSHLHDDERCAEAKQSNHYKHDVGSFPGWPQNSRRIPVTHSTATRADDPVTSLRHLQLQLRHHKNNSAPNIGRGKH